MTEIQILIEAKVEGNIIKLAEVDIEEKKLNKLRNRLNKVGGRWNKKLNGFVFRKDPTETLKNLISDNPSTSIPRFHHKQMPHSIAYKLVSLAELFFDDKVLVIDSNDSPIFRCIKRVQPDLTFDFCEIDTTATGNGLTDPKVRKVSTNLQEYQPGEIYDIVLAKPPLLKNVDIDYIFHMYKLLKPGGRMVTIATTYWEEDVLTQKQSKFKFWLTEKSAKIKHLPQGTFKSREVNIPTCIISLDKPVFKNG